MIVNVTGKRAAHLTIYSPLYPNYKPKHLIISYYLTYALSRHI